VIRAPRCGDDQGHRDCDDVESGHICQ
jgi:hypothetical protein